MAEFLTTTGVSHHLERIINEADELLVIVSPYLSVNPRIQGYIESKCWEHKLKTNREYPVQVAIIYRDEKQAPGIEAWLESLPNTLIGFCKNLHAKCYLNEKEALITSMNLYDYSQIHNYEMGVLVSEDADPEFYLQVYEEMIQIRRAIVEVHHPDDWDEKAQRELEFGFCVRCGEHIPPNLTEPYCNRCFRKWNRYKNPDYEEKHCHTCGADHSSSMAKPLCLSCFRKYRSALGAAS